MTSPAPDVLSSNGSSSAQIESGQPFVLAVDMTTGTAEVPFGEPQRPPQPPADTRRTRIMLAQALGEGDPNGDSLPREDGAPYRD